MRRVSAALVTTLVVLSSGALVTVAQSWSAKPYHEWTDADLAVVTTDSPWAKKKTLTVDAASEAGRPVSGPGSGTGGGMGGGRGRGGGPRQRQTLKLVLSWYSALPMRQAAVRETMKSPGAPPADAATLLAPVNDLYVIRVQGVPDDVARLALASGPAKTVLKAGKRAIPLTRIATRPAGATTDLFLIFSATPAITLDDKTAEVDVHLGQIQLKQKFTLKDMLVAGRLEL